MSRTPGTATATPPCGDPYAALGIEFGSSDADIAKAYRKLALKLHPDRQRRNLPKAEADALARRFHDANEARDFLLDPEHAAERRRYDDSVRGRAARRAEDERRDRGMTDRRRRMREELSAKERRAASGGAADAADDDDLVEALRREGKRMRERHSEWDASGDRKRAARERRERRAALEARQVRIRWSRARAGRVHTERSIAGIMSRFGRVEEVEIVGAKGNAALVTFADPTSCRPCVEAYLDSDVMRAAFVGDRKEDEEAQKAPPTSFGAPRPSRDRESLEEHGLRRAAERERLLRRMEMEEAGAGVEGVKDGGGDNGSAPFSAERADTDVRASGGPSKSAQCADYPPKFPIGSDDSGEDKTPLQRLEEAERQILGNILSPEALGKIQVCKWSNNSDET